MGKENNGSDLISGTVIPIKNIFNFQLSKYFTGSKLKVSFVSDSLAERAGQI